MHHPLLKASVLGTHYFYRNAIGISTPNEDIVIHKGIFDIEKENGVIAVDGVIAVSWEPSPRIIYYGKTEDEINSPTNPASLKVEGETFGRVIYRKTSSRRGEPGTSVSGRVTDVGANLQINVQIDKIVFSIPNLGDLGLRFQGQSHDELGELYASFDDELYNIRLFRVPMYEILELRMADGGYCITYVGEITKKSGALDYNKVKTQLGFLNGYLSMICGRKTSAIFFRGVKDEEVVWTDYSLDDISDPVDQKSYRYFSFFRTVEPINFNLSWNRYKALWKDESSRNFIEMVGYYYFESNKDSAQVEISIISAQICMEIISNWIFDKKKILSQNEVKELSAASKIRILLALFGISHEVPLELNKIISMPKSKHYDFSNGPVAVTSVRNSLTHAKDFTRKFEKGLLNQILKLELWYIDIFLLHILGHSGFYYNRIKSFQDEITSNLIL